MTRQTLGCFIIAAFTCAVIGPTPATAQSTSGRTIGGERIALIAPLDLGGEELPVQGLLASAKRLVAQSTERPPQAGQASKRKNDELYWSGLLLTGIGAYMLVQGLGPGQKITTCTTYGVVSCTEIGGDRAVWLATGGGLLAAGLTMAAIGGQRVPVSPSSGIRVAYTVAF